MKILFVADIVARIGCETTKKILPEIFAKHLTIVQLECVALTFITNMLIALSTQTSQ